jgi:lysine 6-dehydrogenase
MATGFSYIVLGAGKQGVAAAFDILRFGRASRLTLADSAPELAKKSVQRLRRFLDRQRSQIFLTSTGVDGRREASLKNAFKGHQAVLSALPYYLNPGAAKAAIAAKVHYADLGGHFDTTREILKLDSKAKKAEVTLIPDCGVSPGMSNSLALRGIEQLDETSEVRIYCGGLPQNPQPPLGYKIVFNLEGVLGNYFGKAYVLRDGKVALLPSFSDKEEIDLGPPLGKLESFVTGGATSTCPWTFQGKIRTYEYKTLRYPGHHEKIQTLKDLGLLETAPVQVDGCRVIPRRFFVALAEPRLRFPDERDLLAMRVIVRGRKNQKGREIRYDVLEYFDPETGFTAMQRTTGFSAAVVLEMLAQGIIRQRGVVPVERAVPSLIFLEEIRKRGIEVKETVSEEQPGGRNAQIFL